MDYMILSRNAAEVYNTNEQYGTGLSTIKQVLDCCEILNIDEQLAWARDHENDASMGLNELTWDKRGDQVVFERDYAPDEEEFLPLYAFVSMLEQWKEVYAQKPYKILMTLDNGNYRIYPIASDEELARKLSQLGLKV